MGAKGGRVVSLRNTNSCGACLATRASQPTRNMAWWERGLSLSSYGVDFVRRPGIWSHIFRSVHCWQQCKVADLESSSSQQIMVSWRVVSYADLLPW